MKNKEYIRLYNLKRFTHEISRRRYRKHLNKQKSRVKLTKKYDKSDIKAFEYNSEKVPSKFCLFTNTKECLQFFTKINRYLTEGKKLFIDMGNIKIIDASSIIYFLSMLKNLKHRNVNYQIRGNVPRNITNYKYLVNTGFFNYLSSSTISLEKSNDTIMIREGRLVQNDIAKLICDFIIRVTGKHKYEIKPYYEMIIELMNNTKHHAYEDGLVVHNWYIYCEAEKHKAKITFFDNGFGIPTTVYKNKLEVFQHWLTSKGINTRSDIDSLIAALDGAFKTRTQKEHRGKGLPMIMGLIQNGIINNTKILTNHAYYTDSGHKENQESLQGTLYYWEVA